MGRPKALLRLPTGVTFLEHVVRAARLVASHVVLLGRLEPLPQSLRSLMVLPDRRPEVGPMAGLDSLLQYACEEWALLLSCDMPLLGGEALTRLVTSTADEADAVAFREGAPHGRYHACCTLYHRRLLDLVQRRIADRQCALNDLLAKVNVTMIRPTQVERLQLTNVNSPEDIEALCKEGLLKPGIDSPGA